MHNINIWPEGRNLHHQERAMELKHWVSTGDRANIGPETLGLVSGWQEIAVKDLLSLSYFESKCDSVSAEETQAWWLHFHYWRYYRNAFVLSSWGGVGWGWWKCLAGYSKAVPPALWSFNNSSFTLCGTSIRPAVPLSFSWPCCVLQSPIGI